jgi:ferric-dicitrate binding protein FerR (iron transport regulator)
MNFDQEILEDLIIKELTGSITEPEKVLLQEAVNKYPEAERIRQEMRQKLSAPDVLNTLRKRREDASSDYVIFEAERRNKVKKTKLVASLAVAASIIGFFCFRYLPHTSLFPHRQASVLAAVPKDTKAVTLLLPGGKELALDTTAQQIQASDIALSTQGKTLTYEARSTNAGLATLIVPPGKDYKIHLSDGSQVHLNSGTRLQFALQFNGAAREITLEGEAYIQVAPHPQKPFYVHLPHGSVQVLGTEFNVNTYDSGVHKLALVNGSVKFKAFADSATLKPGREATSTSQGLKTANFDASEVLAWREGRYYFNDATLAEVSRVLTRWYGTPVNIDSKAVAAQLFTGMINKSQDIEVVLKGLKLTNLINYYTDEKGTVHLK